MSGKSFLIFRVGDSFGDRLVFCGGVLRRTKIILKFEYLTGELKRAVLAMLDHRNIGASVLIDFEVRVFREHDRRRVFQLFLCDGLISLMAFLPLARQIRR